MAQAIDFHGLEPIMSASDAFSAEAILVDHDAPAARAVLAKFAALSQVPRPSKHEERVMAWLVAWADGLGLAHQADAAGNLVVRVPATAGRATAPTVALQAHVDMVCEKTPESAHDFMTDPIQLVREGDWLRADGTTLGADNGVAVAMMMALAEAKARPRPPLDLLFTVDEETGLTGALRLDPALIAGRRLINLDSEEEGIFTIGCAGGATAFATLPVTRDDAPAEGGQATLTTLQVEVAGLRGGHSGIDIHLGRANAIVVLADALATIGGTWRLLALEGGKASNAIPRDAWARIVLPATEAPSAVAKMRARLDVLRRHYGLVEPTMRAGVKPADKGAEASTLRRPLTPESSRAALALARALPHGPQAMATGQKGLVEASCNLASVRLGEAEMKVVTGQRAMSTEKVQELNAKATATFAAHGARATLSEGYPAWRPNAHSPLLERCKATFEWMHGRAPRVQVIHAGLECGVIGARVPGLDMISIGPTMQHPHSPSERVNVPSIGRAWEFLAALLARLD
jgi:dipeptidase D